METPRQVCPDVDRFIGDCVVSDVMMCVMMSSAMVLGLSAIFVVVNIVVIRLLNDHEVKPYTLAVRRLLILPCTPFTFGWLLFVLYFILNFCYKQGDTISRGARWTCVTIMFSSICLFTLFVSAIQSTWGSLRSIDLRSTECPLQTTKTVCSRCKKQWRTNWTRNVHFVIVYEHIKLEIGDLYQEFFINQGSTTQPISFTRTQTRMIDHEIR